jgi:alkylated DNA repair dioxygenase AlkB
METFVSHKRKRDDEAPTQRVGDTNENDSTDFKLALLASLNPDIGHEILLDALLSANGSVEVASNQLSGVTNALTRKRRGTSASTGYQSSLSSFSVTTGSTSPSKKPLTRKGRTLHLYSPEDIEQHTPCSIIHNFLPCEEADALLREILPETPTFKREKFKLFDRVVESPHSMCFYVDSWDEAERQKTEYVYNGSYVSDVRPTLPRMRSVSDKVKDAVNAEIKRRIRDFYPEGKKLKYQSPLEWKPNAAFVNCYDGGKESVGYHSDQLTYLGPRAIIGSLSLGVAREFRVRKIIAHDEENATRADDEGQISIHLPHNSLLVMHAEMQENWKHAIAPAQAIDPHPTAGNKRINITYRHYRECLHPKFTPKCKCGIPCVLRCVQKKKGNRGRYMWMCHANYTPGKDGCGFFVWAEFDEDGNPPWAGDFKKARMGDEERSDGSEGMGKLEVRKEINEIRETSHES